MGIYSDFYKKQKKEETIPIKKNIYSSYYQTKKTEKPLTSDEIIKKSPVVSQFKKDLPKTNEASRFMKRFLDSTSLGISGEVDKKTGKDMSYREARSFKDDPLGAISDYSATLAGYAVPGLGWIKGAKLLTKLPKTSKLGQSLLAKKIPKGEKNRVIKTIKEEAKEGAIAGAVLSSAEVGVREAINPDDFSAKENLKQIGLGVAGGIVLDPAISGGIRGISKLASKIRKKPEAEELIEKADAITEEAKKFEPEAKETVENLIKEEDGIIPKVEKQIEPTTEKETLDISAPQPVKLTKGQQKRKENIEKDILIAEENAQKGIEYNVGSIGIGKVKKETKEKFNLKKQLTNLRTNMFDIRNPLKQLKDKDIYELKADTVRANSLARRTNEKEQVDLEGNVLGKSMDGIIDSVGDRVEEFVELLISRHARDRIAKGDEVFSDEFKFQNNATAEGIDKGLVKYESDPNNKIIVDAADEWNKFHKNLRELLVKEKIWTKEFAEELEIKYPNYVPFLREFAEKTDVAIFKSMKEGGSVRGLLNPLVTAKEQSRLYYTFILNNRANVALLKSVQKDEQIYKDMGIEIVGKTKIDKDASLKSLEDDIIETEESLMTKGEKEKFVYAVEDGVKYKIKIEDPKLYEAFALIPEQDRSVAIRGVEKLTRFIKRSATGILAPVWTTKGLFYDTTRALFQAKNPVHHFGYLIGSMIGSLPKAEKFAPNLAKMAQAFYQAGGGYNAILRTAPEFKITKKKSTLRKVGEAFIPVDESSFWGKFQEYFENLNRIAAFNNKLDELGGLKTPENIRKAMKYARGITTDYTTRGKWGIEFEKYFPYTTASLAGTEQILKFMFKNPMKAIGGIGVGVVTPALYEYTRFRNDEDYQKIPEREKYRNIFYAKTEEGKFLKIPIDPQLGFIKQMFLYSIDAYKDTNPAVFKGAMEELNQIYLPPPIAGLAKPVVDKSGNLLDVFSTTSAAPFFALATNKGYADIPVVPKEFELMQLDKKFKYNEKTTIFAKTLAQIPGFPLNPFQIDYLIKSFGGDFARYLMPFFSEKGLGIEGLKQGGTLQSEQLFRNFMSNPTLNNNLSEQFYVGRNALTLAKNNFEKGNKPLPEWYSESLYKAITSQANNSVTKKLLKLRELERKVSLDKNLNKKQREEQLKKIAETRNLILVKWNSAMKVQGVPLTTKR